MSIGNWSGGSSGRIGPNYIFVALVIAALAIAASAGIEGSGGGGRRRSDDPRSSEIRVAIENFGKVTDFYYRGAQPRADEYEQLASIGVRTVIDLRDDPRDYARPAALKSGMNYINIRMSDTQYPEPGAASRFLEVVNNRENWPVFVHCAGGRHRTGAMTAVYRMTMEGWDVNRAYAEMKDYDFYTRWGHKAIKQFVFDYFKGLSARKPEVRTEVDR